MDAFRTLAIAGLLGAGAMGCATTGTLHDPARWERRVLAPGVELHVSEQAGPGAVAAAEEVTRAFRSQYLPAY